MNKKFKLALIPLAVSLLLTGCGESNKAAQAGDSAVKAKTEAVSTVQPSATLEAGSIVVSARDVADRAANWQLEQLGNLSYIPESHRAKSENPKFWIQASFYIGLTRWAETTSNKDYLRYIEEMAKEQNYELLLDRPYHADDHTIGQTYLWLTEQTGNKDAYKPTQELFDKILANPPKVGLEMLDETSTTQNGSHFEGNCQDRWCWADALYMAPRTWLKLSNVTGDPKYFEYADKEFWASADYLFSDKYGLFFRDSRYFDMKSENGKPVFWGRGNGWVFAAIPLIIDDLPAGHPSRDRYIELYKKNAAGLMKLQRENGYWPASLMDPDIVKTPEVSATGFITFGLAWGVNNGILTDARSKEIVEKGWHAIEDAVEPNGRVNWVQHVGKSPDPVKKTDSQLYGVGAVLLAASEMVKWED
ncbi:family 88 glycosyl hydrolase [Pseudoalteromonas sp. A601]|uniref:glycoside hydrolase family 88/105 protein n=1 Tax=Pseudoalteromonas sp. A601 TaxID=1967839 RepID=UPI000B3D25A7|nr:glycoside hydrolase family 88 protein [Pseudoalteromonas sp. A601]OUS70990.1 family 88 glycosyl hydrolase [Pseudoalteromonas sp. A601]